MYLNKSTVIFLSRMAPETSSSRWEHIRYICKNIYWLDLKLFRRGKCNWDRWPNDWFASVRYPGFVVFCCGDAHIYAWTYRFLKSLLLQAFNGNQATCLKVQPRQIEKVVWLVGEYEERVPELLDLLSAIVKVATEHITMTSWRRNAFRITCPFWGESTGGQ